MRQHQERGGSPGIGTKHAESNFSKYKIILLITWVPLDMGIIKRVKSFGTI